MTTIRIALIGSLFSKKTSVAKLLSEELSIGYASIDEDFKFDEIDKVKSKHIKIEQMITGLAYFHERIRNEKSSSFISDGSALHEFILTKTQYSIGHKIEKNIQRHNKIDIEFKERFVKIIIEYIKKTYTSIYLLNNAELINSDEKIFDETFQNIFINLAKKSNIQYIHLRGNVRSLVNQIIEDINITNTKNT